MNQSVSPQQLFNSEKFMKNRLHVAFAKGDDIYPEDNDKKPTPSYSGANGRPNYRDGGSYGDSPDNNCEGEC